MQKSAGQSVGLSAGKSNATSTSTITSTITSIITSIITSKRTKKHICKSACLAALLFSAHLNVQSEQKCDTLFDEMNPSQSYSFFQYLLRQMTKTNPEAFQRLPEHIKNRVSSIYKAHRLFLKKIHKYKFND